MDKKIFSLKNKKSDQCGKLYENVEKLKEILENNLEFSGKVCGKVSKGVS